MKTKIPLFKLEDILEKAYNEQVLAEEEIIFLLGLEDEENINRLFSVARSLRYRYFGNKVFLYGFLYFSTWCRNYCIFCFYRAPNVLTKRYRKTRDEITQAACRLAESGVHLIDLTMGEDPFYRRKNGFKFLVDLVKAVKIETGLPVMVSPGVIPKQVLIALSKAGADWYACYQETHNPQLFSQLRPGQNYNLRLFTKYFAKEIGLLVEEGILTGVGDSLRDIVTSINAMKKIGAHQLRVMSFVPQKGTPMESWPSPPRIRELKIIAVLRLLFPDRLIPASLDIDGISGLKERLEAGANVVTSLIPPQTGLAGVSQSSLDIDEGYRTVKGVLPLIEEVGLMAASREDYFCWISNEKERLVKEPVYLEVK
ncbi:methylornithine synthase PylB [Candidatus Aerophobetes bacterium]|uniref:Methylornithine synthase PylB n=1 Tax=Aerophobetes bacterium TaxID=2030807 RepID=A0A662D838_UNCAE|nr:MAG: methylornithine synthase PylB [Candidatus Aerophobetes bacterium]